MTIHEVTQKQGWMEDFNSVVALYGILKSNSAGLRVKQAVYRQGEVEAQPIDFIIDVEVKTKRLLGQSFYELFLRSVYNENTEILPEYMRESLGRVWREYGITPEGSYSKLYFNVKNAQVRSYMSTKETNEPGTEHVAQFD